MLLIGRLAGRDLQYRPAQAVLLLLAITAATTVLSLALALHGVAQHPYQQTRAATRGPDVVAAFGGGGPTAGPQRPGPQGPGPQATSPGLLAEASSLTGAAGVTGHGGPYPVASVVVRLGDVAVLAEAEGRDLAPAAVDQPKLTAGSWVRRDGIVLERTFAEVLGAHVGDPVTLEGRRYTVAGIAVTAASAPYPNMCFQPGGTCVADIAMACSPNACTALGETLSTGHLGLAWVTERDARLFASPAAPLGYIVD